MSSMAAESVFSLIAQLPPPERAKLRQMMDRHLVLAGLDQLLPWIHQWRPEIDADVGETAGK